MKVTTPKTPRSQRSPTVYLFCLPRGMAMPSLMALFCTAGAVRPSRRAISRYWLLFGGECPDSIQFRCCPRLSNVRVRGILHGARSVQGFGVRVPHQPPSALGLST